jgi:hypothetical protein
LDLKASKEVFVDRNAKINCVLTNNVTIKFSNKLIFVVATILYGEFGTKKSHVVRERSLNGEIHFIFPEAKFVESSKNAEYFDEAEIRKIMKKEASKPLLLLREE